MINNVSVICVGICGFVVLENDVPSRVEQFSLKM